MRRHLIVKIRTAVRGMSVAQLTQFITITLVLTIGLTAVVNTAFRVNVGANWEEQRCDPYVVPIAGFFKPSNDPRTAAQFATDNWSFCQKEYVQNAIRIAAEVPQELADAEAATVGIIQDVSSVVADVFFDLWNVCYESYTAFMEQMKGVAKKFQNFMVNLYGIIERLNASALSIIYGLIALIISILNSIQVTLIVAIIVIGIIIALQIILFFVLLPISGLIITVTAIVSVVVVAVATAIAAAMVAELFEPGCCFAKGTPVQLPGGATKPIEAIRVGDTLSDGGRVTAVHTFRTNDPVYNLHGVRVTGDHLLFMDATQRMYVSEHPDSVLEEPLLWSATDLWCLTTTTRRIPCLSNGGMILFADWEEIAEEDMDALKTWFKTVWRTLNKGEPAPHNVAEYILESEAGISPDCKVMCQSWWGRPVARPIRDVRIGDRVFDGPDSTTLVVGKVLLAGDQTTDAVEVAVGQLVSCACWTKQSGLWKPAVGPIREIHLASWQQLYTQSGQFILEGGVPIRDASDVGLSSLRPLVESIVLKRGTLR